jgi:hypothetical protein
MMAWLPVGVLAVVQITVRLVSVAAIIWQERARANSHCVQMRAASTSGVTLFAWRRDSEGLAILPRGQVSHGENAEAGPRSEEAPAG